MSPAPSPGADWSGCDLHDADLAGLSLSGMKLGGANLAGANLAGADLSGANLDQADLTGVDLSTTTLTGVHANVAAAPTAVPAHWLVFNGGLLVGPGADLTGANLSHQTLTGWDLTGATLTNVNLTSSVLTGADLTSATLSGAVLSLTDLRGATLSGASFAGASLFRYLTGSTTGTPAVLPAGYTMRNGYLFGPNVDLSGQAFPAADLAGLNLNHSLGGDYSTADLDGSDLTQSVGGSFAGASLKATVLTSAQLDSSDFTGAHLEGAHLAGVHAQGTNWTDVHAHGADLSSASLAYDTWTGADFSSANLSHATITLAPADQAALTSATWTGATWTMTGCPDGQYADYHADRTCLSAIDTTPPAISMTGPATGFSLTTSIPFTWTVTETGSGVKSQGYELASGPATGALGAWSTDWAIAPTARGLTISGKSGQRYCLRVQAGDNVNLTSTWPAARCTVMPVDDTGLAASRGWTRVKRATGWEFSTYTQSTVLGSALSTPKSVSVRQVGIIATQCPTCGAVTVYLGKSKVGSISLASTHTHARVLLMLKRFSSTKTGVVKLVVATKARLVRVDGLAASN